MTDINDNVISPSGEVENPIQLIKALPPPLTDEIKGHFKSSVQTWLSIDEKIAHLREQIKILRDKKTKEIEPEIMDFMKTYNISDLNTQNGRLKYSEKTQKKALSRKNIFNNLLLYYNDDGEAGKITDFLYDNRDEKICNKITKLKARKMPLNLTT